MNQKTWKYLIGILALALISAITALITYPEEKLHLIACDVGQGDAILAVYKDIQILIDGGPGSRVLNCLENHIPYWDREIEVVVLTHPQSDHYTGLIEVFRAYGVDTFVISGLDSSNQGFNLLKKVVGGSDTRVVEVKNNMVIRLGLIHLDIIHPSEEFIAGNASLIESDVLGFYTSNDDPNEFSIVATLGLKDFKALLTGDVSGKLLDELVERGKIEKTNYIKIPHHGSRNGISEKLLEMTEPEIAVISAGKDNSYGHPHKETLEILKDKNIKILRTDQMGDIEIITDGERIWKEK